MGDGDLRERIDTMYANDCRGAWTLVVLLWITIGFVLLMSWPYIPDGGVRTVALIAAALVLLFNTASILALVRHYREDKDFIYGLDIRQLDASRND